MQYKISDISKEEHPDVIRVWEASVRATHLFLKEEDILFIKKMIPHYLDAVRLFAVRDTEGKIAGFLGASDHMIEMLFIDPNAQGQGIGKRLMTFAFDTLNLSKVDVNEQNEQAIGFYQHLGFSIIGRSALDSMGKPFPILHLARQEQL